jgi:hypothetical protein
MGNYLCHAALAALIAIASAQGKWIMTEASAQTATQAQGRELPVFEVDKSWPKVPPQYKVGDVSSINSDSEGNIRTSRAVGAGVRPKWQFRARLGRRRYRL